MADVRPRDEIRIAALKRERASYLARGDVARAEMVDDELAKYGVGEPNRPKNRATQPQETAAEPDKRARPRKATDTAQPGPADVRATATR